MEEMAARYSSHGDARHPENAPVFLRLRLRTGRDNPDALSLAPFFPSALWGAGQVFPVEGSASQARLRPEKSLAT